MNARNVTGGAAAAPAQSTANTPETEERFRLYRLCECDDCGGAGKLEGSRCASCRGEGRALQLVATCGSPEAVGVALVTLGREHEWDACPIGILDRHGAKNEKWLVSPWLPSPRNVTDAARLMASRRRDIK